jgi:membrane associated rhomboid family serine protease
LSAGESKHDQYSGRPSVCRSCGALVGAGESACGQCGTPLVAPPSDSSARRAPAYDSETMNFARAILARPATFTIIFLVANVLVFLLTTISGGADNPGTIIGYGAKVNSQINGHGEWWRFVTPIFLHGGLLHLLFNMYGLWVIGPYVEKLYGSAKFVVFWVVTGVAGVFASYLTVRPNMHIGSLGGFLFKTEDAPSVGASGALFGLIGILFVFGIKFRHELPEGFKRAFGTGMLPIIVINLFIGFLGRGYIDNAAHLGGLVSGACLALVVGYKRPGPRGSITVFWHVLQVAALALVVVSFFLVWRHYNGPRPELSVASLQRGLFGGGAAVAAHLKAINDGSEAFVKAYNNGDVSEVDAAIKTINQAPSLDNNADALRLDLMTLLERVHA